MPEYTYLEDVTGPYKGLVRPYLKHAAENALACGFARRPGDAAPPPEPVAPAAPAGPETAPAEPTPEVEPEPASDAARAATPLPEDFPGRAALVDAGHATVESVQAIEDLTVVGGVGPATAKKVRAALAEMEG